jgi:hypothetical protein
MSTSNAETFENNIEIFELKEINETKEATKSTNNSVKKIIKDVIDIIDLLNYYEEEEKKSLIEEAEMRAEYEYDITHCKMCGITIPRDNIICGENCKHYYDQMLNAYNGKY